ncbi:hypothetical protein CPT_Machias_255 [Staphylococcus phage Machias]|nr:hypothetical protein CPT_Machias_255 [Staphylococcus phage Machias]
MRGLFYLSIYFLLAAVVLIFISIVIYMTIFYIKNNIESYKEGRKNNIRKINKSKIKIDKTDYNKAPLIKKSDRLIDFNNNELSKILNQSFKLKNTFDNKERYYSLHYLLSHPELEFYLKEKINLYKANVQDNKDFFKSPLQIYSIESLNLNNGNVEKGLLNYDRKMELDKFVKYFINNNYKDTLKSKDIYSSFNIMINEDINDLVRLEKEKLFMSIKDFKNINIMSFLGSKIMILVTKKLNKIIVAAIDENKNVYMRELDRTDDLYGSEADICINSILTPKIEIVNIDEKGREYLNKNMITRFIYDEFLEEDYYGIEYAINKRSEFILNKESLKYTKNIDKVMTISLLSDDEYDEVKVNMRDLLEYIYKKYEEKEVDDSKFDLLKEYQYDRTHDKDHWSNLIETNYKLNNKEKKKFIKNLNQSIIEKEKMEYIEEYKHYMNQ